MSGLFIYQLPNIGFNSYNPAANQGSSLNNLASFLSLMQLGGALGNKGNNNPLFMLALASMFSRVVGSLGQQQQQQPQQFTQPQIPTPNVTTLAIGEEDGGIGFGQTQTQPTNSFFGATTIPNVNQSLFSSQTTFVTGEDA